MALPRKRNYTMEELLCMCNRNGIRSFENQNGRLIITLINGQQFSCYIQDSGSSGEGCCYEAGDGISIDDGVISTDASIIEITRNIVVIGDVGGYHDGDIIPEGTTIQEILNGILRKTYDVEPVPPTAGISLQNVTAGETYEVGEYVGEIIVNSNYNDGEFVGEEGYSYSIPAGCLPTIYHYQYANYSEETSSSNIHAYPIDYLQLGTYSFSVHVEYTQSQGHPIRSDGTNSHVSIPAGDTDRVEASFNCAYKFFYGCLDTGNIDTYVSNINSQSVLETLNLNEGFCENGGITTIDSIQTGENGKNSIVLVLPRSYSKIIYTENSFGASVDVENRWELENTFNYTHGNTTTEYYVYILYSMLPLRYNNIRFTQQ